MCHLRSADLQPQDLIKFQFREQLRIRAREVRPQIMTRFRHQILLLPESDLPEAAYRSSRD